jgi:hypothetical protein
MTRAEIERLFPEGTNIGLTLTGPEIIIALISGPHDRLKSERYIQKHLHLAEITQYSTSEGVNLILWRPDLPRWAEYTPLMSRPTRSVYALLFHATSQPHDLLIPPSVGNNGFVYQWTVCGKSPTHRWATLQSWFLSTSSHWK